MIASSPSKTTAGKTIFRVLLAISFCHLLNDLVQSLIPAICPLAVAHVSPSACVSSRLE